MNTRKQELKPFDLVVQGFPCNQFGKQEPGENSEILLGLKYVHSGGGYIPNFQHFEKGDVNGDKEQKVFTFLKVSELLTLASSSLIFLTLSCTPVLTLLSLWTHSDISWEPIKVHDIRWNFEKFLVGPDGVPVMRQFHRAPVSVVKSDILAYLKQFKTK
ncbi:hypothetical protein MC885_021444 [Smutsia gigantea]|nr:hypothetical protein MC885_021444 [Smutsia gigantea]